MNFRNTLLLLLATNATAFVPSCLSRNSRAFLPIASSLSDPDTDTNQVSIEEDSPVISDEIGAEVESTQTNDETPAEDESVAASTGEEASESLSVGQTTRHTIYVGNLPYSTSVKEVRDLVSEHAEVRYVNLPRNRETGDIKGFAFVDVGSDEEIPKVVEALNGMKLADRPLRVSRSLAKDQIRSTRKTIDGTKKLYVGNLSFSSSKEDIEEFFGQYGEVKDVFIPVNKYGESRGFAFISVKEEDTGAVIDATDGIDFMGRTIAVNHPIPPGSKPAKREKPGRMKLFIGNLSFYTTDDTLAEVFEEFGDVYDCYIPKDSASNNSRGFGFVSMATDDANASIDALDGCELDGRIISVNEAKPRATKSPRDDNFGSDDGENDDLSI